LGKKFQTHIPFDTVLEMEPYLAPGQASPQKMKLIGIISHQGTKDQGHYVVITKRGNEWTSYNDTITAQTTLTQLHQTQAYIMIYRKMEHSEVTEIDAPRDSTIANQQLPEKKSKPSHKTQHRNETSPLHPDPPIKIPEKNLPRQEGSDVGVSPHPNSVHKEGPTNENLEILETLLSNRLTPQAPENRGKGEVGGAAELNGASVPPSEKADHRQIPLEEKGLGQSENEQINFSQSISAFLHLSQGRIEELTSLLSELSGTPLTMEMTYIWLGLESQRKEIPYDSQTKKLIDGLSEDPEDYPAGFIPIIERHNARLKKAHLLHEATRYIIKQRWLEGATLEDIGKFLHSWAPEPYRNKPMQRGMIQALLHIAPNSQAWTPIDLSNCIFRNTEATDSIDDVVRAIGNLGTSEDPTLQDPKIS